MNKSKNVAGIMIHTLHKQLGLSISLLLAVIGVIVLSLIPPQLLRIIIDDYFTGGSSHMLFVIALFYFGVLFLIGLFDFLKETLLTIYGQRMTRNIRSNMMEKHMRMKADYFTENDPGIVVSYFNNDVDAIQTLFTNGVVSMAVDGCKIVGIVVSIFVFSKTLGVIILILIPLIYAITRFFQKRMKKAQLKNRVIIAQVNNHIPESIRNLCMIHSYHKEKYMEDQYIKYLQKNFDSVEKVNFYDAIFSPIILMIRAAVIALIVLMCEKQAAYLGITVGMVAAAIDLISNLFSPIENLGMELQSIQQAAAGMKRVDEYLTKEEDSPKDESIHFALGGKEENQKKDSGLTLRFQNVSFSYDEKAPVLRQVNFEVKENENVTFMGRTGAGKSTLFKLILGLLEPQEGNIKIGGINVGNIPYKEKHRLFGYVEQTFHFVEGSIVEQIRLHDASITKEQVKKALKFVGLDSYILQLSDGYDTIATDTLFSQGQRQLLSIARAVVLDPPILLLDEMTANLDSETEQRILSVLQSAASGRMVLSISHRQSAMLKDNRMLWMEEGILKEQTPCSK